MNSLKSVSHVPFILEEGFDTIHATGSATREACYAFILSLLGASIASSSFSVHE